MLGTKMTLSIDLQAEGLLRGCLSVPGGVGKWNALMHELYNIGVMSLVWENETDEPLVVIGLLMGGVDLSGMQLSGLNLTHVYLDRCRFDGADLRGAEIAVARFCSFRAAHIGGVTWGYCDISGADFTDAVSDAATEIERGCYDYGYPPLGLPEHLLAQCRPDLSEVKEPLIKTRALTLAVAAHLMIPGN